MGTVARWANFRLNISKRPKYGPIKKKILKGDYFSNRKIYNFYIPIDHLSDENNFKINFTSNCMFF